jgi:hypothetical protein
MTTNVTAHDRDTAHRIDPAQLACMVKAHHESRQARIVAIAEQLSAASDETLRQIERSLGLRPMRPRYLPWWARWWSFGLFMVLLATLAELFSPGSAGILLIVAVLTGFPLYLLQHDQKKRGGIE